MSLTAREQGGGDFQLAPEGTHIARCYRLVDLGTQYSDAYETWKPRVMISWELCEEKMEDGRPLTVSAFLTNSLHEKANLRGILDSWRGKSFTADELAGFDLRSILGTPCLVSVVHKKKGERTYDNVKTVTSLPKGSMAPELENDVQFYDIDSHDAKVFDSLSEGLQEKIKKSQEWVARQSWGAPTHGEDDGMVEEQEDEVPF